METDCRSFQARRGARTAPGSIARSEREIALVTGQQAALVWLLVDGSARLLDASEPAARLLDRGAPLRLGHDRKLRAADDEQTRRLHLFVAAVAAGRRGGALQLRSRDGNMALIEASPSGVAAPAVFRPDLSCCALLCVRGPPKPASLNPAWVRSVLHCTLAEAEVAVALAAGQSPPAIASERKVRLTTVRTQIRALLAAADTTRIGELVAKITGYARRTN